MRLAAPLAVLLAAGITLLQWWWRLEELRGLEAACAAAAAHAPEVPSSLEWLRAELRPLPPPPPTEALERELGRLGLAEPPFGSGAESAERALLDGGLAGAAARVEMSRWVEAAPAGARPLRLDVEPTAEGRGLRLRLDYSAAPAAALSWLDTILHLPPGAAYVTDITRVQISQDGERGLRATLVEEVVPVASFLGAGAAP